MAYRTTAAIEARKSNLKQRIIKTTTKLVAQGGFGNAPIKAVAEHTQIATGTIYRYFPSKADLFIEVFQIASEKEFTIAKEATEIEGSTTQRLQNNMTTFASRALRGPDMAYALIAEPVDPLVEAERLIFRHNYANYLKILLDEGIRTGEFCQQNTLVSAFALIGLMGEVLLNYVAPSKRKLSNKKIVQEISDFALRAVIGQENEYAKF